MAASQMLPSPHSPSPIRQTVFHGLLSCRAPSARPTAMERPWPRLPAEASQPMTLLESGCMAKGEPKWLKVLRVSSGK